MSEEYTPEDVNQVQKERALFQRVLLKDSDGNNVMAWIGNYCGAWAQDPAVIKPDLIAFWNQLLGMCGIVHPQNLQEIAEKLSQAANNSDLAEIRKRIKQTEGGANAQA